MASSEEPEESEEASTAEGARLPPRAEDVRRKGGADAACVWDGAQRACTAFSSARHFSRYRMYSIDAESTCSLCMSWPAHAGIMSLSTPNSSFIFERRRRSIKLCAVLRAIFLPAAVVGPFGCLRLVPADAVPC